MRHAGKRISCLLLCLVLAACGNTVPEQTAPLSSAVPTASFTESTVAEPVTKAPATAVPKTEPATKPVPSGQEAERKLDAALEALALETDYRMRFVTRRTALTEENSFTLLREGTLTVNGRGSAVPAAYESWQLSLNMDGRENRLEYERSIRNGMAVEVQGERTVVAPAPAEYFSPARELLFGRERLTAISLRKDDPHILEYTAEADPRTALQPIAGAETVVLKGTVELDDAGCILRETVSFRYSLSDMPYEEEAEIVFEEAAALPAPIEPAGTAFLLPDLYAAELYDTARLCTEAGRLFVERTVDADITALGTVIRQSEKLFFDRREALSFSQQAKETITTPEGVTEQTVGSRFENGMLLVLSGEESESFRADGEALLASMLEGLLISRPLPASLEAEMPEEEASAWVLRWNAADALGEETAGKLCEALLGDAAFLADRAESFRTQRLILTLQADKASYLPVSLKLEYGGVYLIDGQEYPFTAVIEERYTCGVSFDFTVLTDGQGG